jgi:hypothetical protein
MKTFVTHCDHRSLSLSLAICLGVAVTDTHAQTLTAVSGRVVARNGQPIQGVSVVVRRPDGRTVPTRVTNASGRYMMSVPPGEYRVRFVATGYRALEGVVTIRSVDTLPDFVMQSDRVGLLGGLHLGTPATASIAVGPSYLIQRSFPRPTSSLAELGFVFMFAEPGVRAGRLSLGYFSTAGNLGTGWSIRASLLQRWRDREPYAGGELSAFIFGLGLRGGYFLPAGGSGARDPRLTLDFSLGV